ncbi:hypothetical protein [Bacteroides heparinolyticus]
MEYLNMSYKEVFEIIPYRNLIIMQKDKLREVHGEVMEEVTEEEFFKGRI